VSYYNVAKFLYQENKLSLLPNFEKAIIEPDKLYNYVLSSSHPVGRFKAAFFRSCGYSSDNWRDFESSLRSIISYYDAVEAGESRYGKKYVVEGKLSNSSGDIVNIISVWVILNGDDIPRFITAYPGGLR
jgi:hypothetical protein